jgi:hypothetical protein
VSSPETIDFLSFRRTFTLLILLVVLPSAGLSGFGVLAIINERAAVEKRLEAVWATRLNEAQSELQRALDQVQGSASASGLVLRLNDIDLCGRGFTAEGGLVESSDGRLQVAMTGLAPELGAVPTRPVVFSMASTQGTYLLSAMRDGARVVGCQVDPKALERVLGKSLEAQFVLVPVQREVPQSVLDRKSVV